MTIEYDVCVGKFVFVSSQLRDLWRSYKEMKNVCTCVLTSYPAFPCLRFLCVLTSYPAFPCLRFLLFTAGTRLHVFAPFGTSYNT